MRDELYKQIDEAVKDELKAANQVFPANNSRHESYAVLLEEFEELKNEVEQLDYWISLIWGRTKDNAPYDYMIHALFDAGITSRKLIAEAVQTSAMIDKFIKYMNNEEEQRKLADQEQEENK
jgi:glutathionylspermidine synthase